MKEFIIKRIIDFKFNAKKEFVFRGVDQRGVPFSFLKNVVSIIEDKKSEKRQELKG